MKFSKNLVLASVLLTGPAHVAADVIDFETVPGVGVPFEGLVVSDQFAATEGVTFSLLGGGAPVIAEVGPPLTAFQGPPNHTGSDNPAPGQDIGQFFLTDDGQTVGLAPQPLVIDYDPPATEASGFILDMDVDERFTIEARAVDGTVLTTILIQSGDPLTGDGIATPWNLVRAQPEIARLILTGDRNTPGFFGLGFDNFDARAAPDTDEDGVFDNADNCILIANSMQRDTDADGIGNYCDADIAPVGGGDCVVDFLDLGAIKQAFFSVPAAGNWNADADFNGDAVVDFIDLGILKAFFFGPPGPSGQPNPC